MPKNRIKLFCIPYGGASALVYTEMEKFLNDSIELFPVELAGRGLRFKDPYYCSFWNAIDEIASTIVDETTASEYALFGHCMGSLITYEVCRKINNMNYKAPIHVFFSGSRAPHDRKLGKLMGEMSEQEVIDELLEIGRIDEALYKDNERLSSFLPVWKADCNMMDHYTFQPYKLSSNMTVFGGKNDELVSFSDLQEWEKYADGKFAIHEIEGDHFFINNNREIVVNIINASLCQ